jgi:PKD repeat protein
MDYDPALQAVVLVGGFAPSGSGLNDTWSFNGAWTNITVTTGPLLDALGSPISGGIGSDPMTWDPALQGLVMADGCSTANCTYNAWSLTWLLNSSGWHTLGYGPGYANSTFLGYGSMAYDPTDGYLVFFGGWDYFDFSGQNWTYTYRDATSGWQNISASDSNGCFVVCGGTPAGREGPALTWDAQYGAVLMVGGYNTSAFFFYNDSWTFLGGQWFPTDFVTTAAPASFYGGYGIALAPNSTDIAPFLVGGLFFGHGASDEWVWENPPAPTIQSVRPNPADNGSLVTVNSAYTVGTGSGPQLYSWVYFGDGARTYTITLDTNTSTPVSLSTNHTYAGQGTYAVSITEYDFFTLNGSSAAVNLTVRVGLSATIHAAPTTLDPGQSVAFSAAAMNGTAPYNYSWNFGDGSPRGHGNTTAHTYAASGTFHVQVTVTDAGGGSMVLNKTVTVNPSLAASASGLPASVTAGHAVNFTASASGGSGTYTYVWVFGDGSAKSTVQNPTHSYATAGTYTATVWANDTLGDSVTKTVAVTVTAPSSTSSPSSFPLPGGTLTLIILIVVIAVIAALAALLLMRRRKQSPPSTSTTGPSGPTEITPPSAGGPPPGAMGSPPPPPPS